MTFISIVLKELLGLFVDDGSLALAILASIGVAAALLHFGMASPVLAGAGLFIALLGLLAENVWRAANSKA